jgi:4-hydroxy-3-methylbut-2-enyl diphosphate reductase
MKIFLAKTAGFCMGVRRAVEMVMDAPQELESPICTYGPLIHNPQVLALLKEKGICVLNEIPSQGTGTVLIRAHGVPPKTKETLKKSGFKVVDATCPRVIKVQTIIRKHTKKNFASIIVGDKDHPEVIGLLGYAEGKGCVVGSLEELEALPAFENAIIVAQTTQNIRLFDSVKTWVNEKFPHYKIFDTICDSTERRQAEVKRMASSVDAIIVVGGHNSGNTQRLLEIAKQTGKPAYHIESETELEGLDTQSLASARHIGITAGASTPNWIIKRVYRTLEALPYKSGRGWRRTFFNIQRVLLLTNLYVSLGAGCLSYACTKLMGISQHFPNFIIAILYVQSMHILNHLTGKQADQYNDPDRAYFYNKHKLYLSVLAIMAGGVGLIIAYTIEQIPFVILLAMSILGLSYNLRIVPERFSYLRYRRIRDIPGSKTLLIAMAWGIVTSLFPSLSISEKINLSTVLVFLWSTGMVFVRTAFFDTLDMQGDRIVGKETIPILLGEKMTMRLLKSILAVTFTIIILASAFNIISSLGFALSICPVFLFLVLLIYEKGHLIPSIRLEFLVESLFVLAGSITLLWSALLINL